MRHFTLAFLALPCLFIACGDGSDVPVAPAANATADGPAVVAERFLRAVQGNDETALAAVLTERARAAVQSGEGLELSGDSIESFEIGESVVDGDEAEVGVVAVEAGEERTSDLLLRREAGDWLVYGMRLDFGDGNFTFDFEETADMFAEIGEELAEEIGQQMQEAFAEAQQAWEQGGTPEEIAAQRAAFEAIVAVSVGEHAAAWRVDVDGGGRSAAEVLAELAGPCGLAIDPGAPTALEQAVELRLEGVSRVEAIERVAEAVGLHTIWPAPLPMASFGEEPAPEPLRFGEGPRPRPAVFAGPFLVEVAEVTEDPPHTVGSIELAVRALGLAPGVLSFQDEMGEFVRLERVRDARDEPLSDESMRHMTTPEVRDGYFTYSFDKELSGLLRDVESIEIVSGEVLLPIPVAVEEVAWERGDSEPRTLASGTLTVSSWGEQTVFSLEGEAASLDSVQVRLAPRKASGDPLGVRFASSNGWSSSLQANVDCPEAPAAVDLKVCTVETVSVPFELGSIPLAHWSEQPEQLTPLSFDGPVPVEVAVVADEPNGEMREVTLRVRNVSNKDAVSMIVDLVYLDARGAELDDFPHSLSGDYDFETQSFGPVVAAGATNEVVMQAAFVPGGTATIHAELSSAEYPDGTRWEAEQ